jgi:hypothetical protein
MSQIIFATPCWSGRHGTIVNVEGSGFASMSDSAPRVKPSIALPSKPIPSSKAISSSAGVIANDFKKPSTSVNHSRMKRMSRSSTVLRTKSMSFGFSVLKSRSSTAAFIQLVADIADRADHRFVLGP